VYWNDDYYYHSLNFHGNFEIVTDDSLDRLVTFVLPVGIIAFVFVGRDFDK